MTIEEAVIGTRVKSVVEFCDVPKGTEGKIVQDYGTGVMVEWDLPDQDPSWPLKDGFDKQTELQYLEVTKDGQRLSVS